MLKFFFTFVFVLASVDVSHADYSMSLVSGTFYGPGRMPDVAMPDGLISVIRFKHDLTGETPFANNGGEPPNIHSGVHSEIWSRGLLSDGVAFNESMDGGIINVGDGALKLLNVVTKDGALKGVQTYRLDSECNWMVFTDLALDPGFASGIIFAKGLVITTGVVFTPSSLQSKVGIPGGVDSAGSLPSGTPVLGRLGDFDFDGTLDGTIVGAANIPLDHIFYPGAAVVQTRNFKTNIPISSFDAATFGMLGLMGYQQIFERMAVGNTVSEPMVSYLKSNVKFYLEDIRLRLRAITHHLSNSTSDELLTRRELLTGMDALNRTMDDLMATLEPTVKTDIATTINSARRLLDKVTFLAKQMKPRLSYNCS